MRILDDVYIGENDQALLHHLIENGHERLQLFFRINYRQQDGTIVRETQRSVFVNSAIGAITENSPINRNAGNIVRPQAVDDGFMQWLAVPLVVLADVDSHQLGFALTS